MSQEKKPRAGPTREQVAKRTVDRLRKFSEQLDTGRPVSEAYSCRRIILDVEVLPYTPLQVRQIRKVLNCSQSLFAKFLNVKLSTVQKWERTKDSQPPNGAACRLLDEIRRDPEYWINRFKSMAKHIPAESA